MTRDPVSREVPVFRLSSGRRRVDDARMSETVPPSPAMLAALRARAGSASVLSYADFVDTALFHPELGYYRRDKKRVGRERGTDFYTASSVGGGVFAALVRSAAATLLGGSDALKEHTLVEIGAEPGDSIFENERAHFAGLKTIRVGEDVEIPDRAVVFANELFDAQPFRRLRFRAGAWRELGVLITDTGELAETELPELSPDAAGIVAGLPTPWHEGFVLDVSPDADRLMNRITAGGWRGVVIFPDYGKPLPELLANSPQGTARAYFQHTQSNDLFSRPGEQDLTYHVVWDALETRMTAAGFSAVTLDRQEAFFMKHASGELEQLFARAAATRDMTLMGRVRELIHPAHLGSKFQVLSGVRL
jgi:SAM-dependent MidA family methyltransferase